MTVIISNASGKLATLAQALASKGGNILAFGSFLGDDPSNREVTFKVTGLTEEEVRAQIEPVIERVIDIRTSRKFQNARAGSPPRPPQHAGPLDEPIRTDFRVPRVRGYSDSSSAVSTAKKRAGLMI